MALPGTIFQINPDGVAEGTPESSGPVLTYLMARDGFSVKRPQKGELELHSD
jgi:hypothetical protein